MSEQDNARKPVDNTELPKQDAACCGPGCNCGSPSPAGGRGRWILGIVILLVAGGLVVRAMVKDNGSGAVPAPEGFSAPVIAPPQAASDATPATVTEGNLPEIAGFSDLNAVAAESAGVFVFVPDRNAATSGLPAAAMRSAARAIEPQLRGKIGLFALKAGSPDCEQLGFQMQLPGVLAMVKGGGMSAVSGEITQTKLVQAFVAASSSGGCGPSGCGPSGCK